MFGGEAGAAFWSGTKVCWKYSWPSSSFHTNTWQGWETRKQPDYTPNPKHKEYQRAYYQRRKAGRQQQPATEPAESSDAPQDHHG